MRQALARGTIMRTYHYLHGLRAICVPAALPVKVGVECQKPLIKLRFPGAIKSEIRFYTFLFVFPAVLPVKMGVGCGKPIIQLRFQGGLSGTPLGCLWVPICPETPPGKSLGPPLGPPWEPSWDPPGTSIFHYSSFPYTLSL